MVSASCREDFFSKLKFGLPFRTYQGMVLTMFEDIKDKQSKFHIVAPPGSGKTILGIEIIRRIGEPAVIFSPTTTIQAQWREKFLMFTPQGGGKDVDSFVSSDAGNIKAVNALTYQVIGTQTENRKFLENLGRKCWIQDLVDSGKVTEAEALDRIKVLEANNREAYRHEVSKYSKRAKRKLLANDGFDLMDLIHTNARRIIEELVAAGTKVIVLDECHHLLDYWAIVLKELMKRIPGVFVVGLTATPPLKVSDRELENYLHLVGDIDFEVPAPAVVKNGNLAPYQCLAYFVEPLDKELKFLKKQRDLLFSLAEEVSTSPSFRSHLEKRLIGRFGLDGQQMPWYEFLNGNLDYGIAGMKFLISQETEVPPDIEVIPEMQRDLSIDDWVTLLEDYCLNCLKTSRDKDDWDLLRKVKAAFRNLGLTLSESGFRRHISPTERVLAFSDSKNEAVVDILGKEFDSLGSRLRAVVITDFEKSSTLSLRRLDGILDPDAGGAVRVLKHLASNPKTNKLDPVMLTGKSVLIDKDFADEFVEKSREWFRVKGLEVELEVKETGYGFISEIVGRGRDWKPKNYVRYATWAFEEGFTQCIVGTRGLLGEGWDSLSLNTLIDLTCAGTYATVNQIRGRSIRLDPRWPLKVANNWDVVCVAPGFPNGDNDFQRFLKKHMQFYGIDPRGRVVKGVDHVDPLLASASFLPGVSFFQFVLINRRSMKRALGRNKAYKLWGVGEAYTNFHMLATLIRKEDVGFRSAYTFKNSLKRLFLIVSAIVAGYLGLIYYFMFLPGDFYSLGFVFIALLAVGSFYSLKPMKQLFRQAFLEIPVDYCLLDMGKAVLATLKDLEMVNKDLSFAHLRVLKEEEGIYKIYLDYSSEEDTAVFSKCYGEVMSPVVDQRYLVSRTESSINYSLLGSLQGFFMRGIRAFTAKDEVYHPVPDAFSRKKKNAETFARYWGRYVGGGKLVYTRNEAGRNMLLRNRVRDRYRIGPGSLEEWK